jgi:hypothetical protein
VGESGIAAARAKQAAAIARQRRIAAAGN